MENKKTITISDNVFVCGLLQTKIIDDEVNTTREEKRITKKLISYLRSLRRYCLNCHKGYDWLKSDANRQDQYCSRDCEVKNGDKQ